MSRSKKSRSLKSVVSVKTGSKSKILDTDGNKGKIPSKNKLSKHKKKPKSAYAKFLNEKGQSDSNENKAAEHPYKAALREEAKKEKELAKETAAIEKAAKDKVKAEKILAEKQKAKSKQENKVKSQPIQEKHIPEDDMEQSSSKDFKDLDGDELLDFFDKF